jgi:hypothetical protein
VNVTVRHADGRFSLVGVPAVSNVRTDDDLPPVAIIDRSPIRTWHKIIFGAIAVLGAVAWATIPTVRYSQSTARGDRADRHRARHQKGFVEVGLDSRDSTDMGSVADADRIMAEDLFFRSQRGLLDSALPIPRGQSSRQNGVRFSEDTWSAQRGDQEHVRSGHAVGHFRQRCRDCDGNRNHHDL